MFQDHLAERGTQARPEFGGPVAGGDENSEVSRANPKVPSPRRGTDILAGVPCYREFEVVDRGRPVHGDAGQHTTRDPVVQIWPASRLDHVASQRGQYMATPRVSRDDRIAQPLERLRGQDSGETVQPVLQRVFTTPRVGRDRSSALCSADSRAVRIVMHRCRIAARDLPWFTLLRY